MKKEIKAWYWYLAIGWMLTSLIFFLIHPVLAIINSAFWILVLAVKGVLPKN